MSVENAACGVMYHSECLDKNEDMTTVAAGTVIP